MLKNEKPAATKPAEVAAAPVPKGRKKLIIIAVAVAAIGAGAGGYFFMGKSDTPHVEAVKAAAPPQRPIFIALEPFTVNLQRETSDQYLQVGITLKIFDAELEERIKTSLPEIRSKVLLLLSTKKASELSSAEGKSHLIKEIIQISNGVLGIVGEAEKTAATPAKPAAASEAGEAGTESEPAATEPAAAPEFAPETEEKKGIVDVLFTSFIIQ